MQGWGKMFGDLVPYLCLVGGQSYEFTWRFSFAFGGLIPTIVLPFRMMMEESETFKTAIENETAECCQEPLVSADSGKAAGDSGGAIVEAASARFNSVARMGRIIANYKFHLIGTAVAWMCLDFIWYGNSLFGGDVVAAFGLGDTPLEKLQFNLIFSSTFNLIGYYFSVYLVDFIGRKNLQLGGFFILTILFGILWGVRATLVANEGAGSTAAFVILYGLTFFFDQFGPNSTTYLIPGEIYTTSARTTCHGISAAMGKVGAIIVTVAFSQITEFDTKLALCVVFGVVGFLVTLVFIPTYTAADLDAINTGRAPILDFSCVQPREFREEQRRAKEMQAKAAPEVVAGAGLTQKNVV